MLKVLLQSLRALLVLTVVTGVFYPVAVLALARVVAPSQALGSRVTRRGTLKGSSLIGQTFTRPEYLWGRPSAAGSGYDATSSGGANVSPVGSETLARIAAERDRLEAANPDATGCVPVLLLTTSGSGLDPHISPEAALWQVPRIAKARGYEDARIRQLVFELAEQEGRTLGLLGEPRVNVLDFNLALDERFPVSR